LNQRTFSQLSFSSSSSSLTGTLHQDPSSSSSAAVTAVDEVDPADTEPQKFMTMSLTTVQALTAGEFLEIQWSATVALALLWYENNE
jgi:hypothetical protein